ADMDSENQSTEEVDPMLLNVQPAAPGAINQAQSASVGAQPAGVGTGATGGSTQAAKTSAAINPPHGQPGHDCAVAVGAPLPSSSDAKPAAGITNGTDPTQGQTPVVEK